MSSGLRARGEFPCQGADTSRHHAESHPFRFCATHYFDLCDRLSVTHAASAPGATPKATFCTLGKPVCPFDPKRVGRTTDNGRRSASRARNAVIELARCNGLDHLLTLTAGPHLASRAEALDAISAYLASRHGRWFAAHIERYVAVAEPFAGQGWHVHIGIARGLSPAVLLRLKETWTRFLALEWEVPEPTNESWHVNVARPKAHHSPLTLGAYLAKHVAPPSRGKRSYRCAIGMARALKETVVAYVTAAVARMLVESFGRPERIVHPHTGAVLGWATVGVGAREYLRSLDLKEVAS